MREMLIKTGEALYGPHWQRELARHLNVNERTMRRWVAGDTHPPDSISSDLLLLLHERKRQLDSLLKSAR